MYLNFGFVMNQKFSLALHISENKPFLSVFFQKFMHDLSFSVQGIRHQCREMFENIVKTYKLLQHSGNPVLIANI